MADIQMIFVGGRPGRTGEDDGAPVGRRVTVSVGEGARKTLDERCPQEGDVRGSQERIKGLMQDRGASSSQTDCDRACRGCKARCGGG